MKSPIRVGRADHQKTTEEKIIEIKYEPNEKQKLFHACPATEVVYGGAKGGGKSCALVLECLAYCLENVGCIAYLFRESYDDLEANLIREWKEKVPKELYSYSETKHCADLVNGSKVFFRYISNEQDAEGYQGRSMDFVGVDELTKHTERAIQILLSCLRSPKGFKPKFKGTANPTGIGHTWVKTRYIDGTNKGQTTYVDPVSGNTIAFIPATVYDNKILMSNDPAYVRRLENLGEKERKAFLLGDWNIFEGQYFSEFSDSIHRIAPFQLENHWRRYITVDYGLDMLAALFIAVDEQKRAYVYKEIYEPNLIISDACKRIKQMTERNEKIYLTYAPPDLWNKRQETGRSFFDIFNQHGVVLTKSSNKRENGWLCMKEWLSVHQGEDGNPTAQLRIFNTCKNLLRTLPAVQFDEKNANDVATEPHELTHCVDALRYFCVMNPLSAKVPEQPVAGLLYAKKKISKAI